MEALASRKPVLATQVAGVGELVEDGINGFLVPPGDVESLAARIRTLAGDPDLRRRMGETGHARVGADFDISVEAARLAQLFLDPDGTDLRPAPLCPESGK